MELSFISSLVENQTIMEFVRLGILYAHLIACCVAIGSILSSDFAMLKALIKQEKSPVAESAHMQHLQTTVFWALVLLWITGLAIIGVDMLGKGAEYLLNPKLQAKIAVVMLLTLNGIFLHHKVLPAIQKAGCLLSMSFDKRTFALLAGVVSGVSWFYAAFLGIGRALSWKYSLVEILIMYPLLIAGGFMMMVLITQWAKEREEGGEVLLQMQPAR